MRIRSPSVFRRLFEALADLFCGQGGGIFWKNFSPEFSNKKFLPAAAMAVFALVAMPLAQAGTIWDGGGANTNINTAGNWDGDALPVTLTDGTQTLTFGTNGATATINTDVNALGLVFNRNNAFTIASGTGNLTIGTGGITNNATAITASRTYTINEGIILNGNQTWSVNNKDGTILGALTVGGVVSGSSAITKTGNGTLTLGGNNTYSGGTLLSGSGSRITASHVNAFGTGNVTITTTATANAGAFVSLGATGTFVNNFTINGTGSANGAIQASGANSTLSGLVTLAGDAMIAVRTGAGNTTLTLAGGINTSGGSNRTLTLNTFGNATIATNQLTISTNSVNLGTGGTLLIGHGIEAGGTGTVNLNVGGNTWGTIIVRAVQTAATSSNATLNLGAANALGSSSSILQLGNNSTALERITVNLNGHNQTIGGLRSFTGSGSASANGTRTVTSANATTLTIDNSSATNYLYDGLISGNISLVKNGTGTQTLSGNNTYTGTTTINAGALTITSNSSLPGITTNGRYSVASGATLGVYNAVTDADIASMLGTTNFAAGAAIGFDTTTGSRTYANVIANTNQGALGLTKLGSNDLTLSNSNTYTGGTTITNGNLTMGANNALGNGALTFNATGSARLLLNGTNQTITGLTVLGSTASVIQNDGSSSSSVGTITFNIGDGVTSNSTSNFYFRDSSSSNVNHGKLALIKTGNGTLDFSTYNAMSYTGGLTVNQGVFSYNAAAALGSTSGLITLGGGTLNYTGASGSSVSTTNTNMALTAGTTSTLNNANGTVTISAAIAGSGNLIKSGAGTLTLSGANTYNGSTTINAGTLQIGAGSTTGALSIGSAIINNGTLTFNRTNTVTQGTDFASDISGTGALIQAGSGNLILTGANTYIGATTISAGTLQIGGGGTTGNLSTTSAITNNGTLVFNRSNTIAQGTDFANVISGSGSVTQAGAGTLILSGANTFTGGVTINAGTLQLGNAGALNSTAGSENAVTFGASSTGALSLNGNSVVIRSLATNATPGTPVVENANAAAATLTVGNSANASSTYAGVIQDGSGGGALSLTKAGTGTLTLSGNNTYTGATTISAGTLSISHANALGATGAGSGTTIASSASLQLSNNITIGETILLNSTGISNAGGIRNTGGNNIISGAITSGASSRIASHGGNLTLTGGYTSSGVALQLGAAAANTSITVRDNVINLGSGGFTAYGTASGSNSVVLDVAGNTFGSVNINYAGTLRTDVSNAWNPSATLVMGSTSGEAVGAANLLNLNGNSQTFASLTSYTVNSTSTINSASAATLTVSGSTSSTFNGTISGAISLVKEGSSTQTLAGTNSYTGTTTINAGTLVATNLQSSSGVTVNNGGSIGAGNAAGAVGTLTVGNITLNGGGGYVWDLGNVTGTAGTNWDLITATNTTIGADANNKFTIYLSGSGTGFSPSTSNATGWNIFQWGNLTSTFDANAFIVNSDNFTGAAPTGSWTINSTGGFLNLSYTAPAATGIWTAGSGNWSNNTNWSTVPQNTSPLEFSGAGGVSTNDNQLNTVGGITFTSGAGAYTLNGTALTIRGGGITNNSTSAQTVAMDITMADSQTFNAGAANLTVSGAIANAGFNLEASGNNTVSISGNISGTGGVQKIGTGTLALSGNNTYSGTTTVNAGTLTLSGGLNNSSVTVNGGLLSQTSTGSIAGTGATFTLTSGNATLAGTNTYAGATTVSAGVLNIQNNNALGTTAGGTTVASGAALQLQGNITVGAEALSLTGTGVSITGALRSISGNNIYGGAITLASDARIQSDAGNLTITGGISGNTRTLTVGGSGNTIINSVIATTTGSLTKTGGGMLTLNGTNTFTGNITVADGTLSVGSIGNAGVASAAGAGSKISLGGGNIGGGLLYTGNGHTTDRTIDLIGRQSSMTINASGSGLLKFTSNITASLTGNKTLALRGSGSGEIAGTIVDAAPGTVAINGNANSGNSTLNLGSVFGVANGSSISGAGIAANTTLTLSGTVATLSNNLTANMSSGAVVTIPGVLNPTAVTKSDAGTWTLSGNNTYTGATTVSAGVLNIQHANALGSTSGNTTVASGAALQLEGGITVGAEALSLNGTGVSTTGALRNISGSNTYGGAITLAGATRINSDADLLTLSGGIGGTQNLTIGGAGNATINSAIATSTGTLTKDGAGTLILSANNTYTGNTTVSLGVINIQHANGLGTTANGTTVSSGAALQLQGGITVGAEALSLNGTGVSTDGALRNISGSNTYGGAITLAGATRINSDAGLLTLSGGIGGATQNLTIGGAGNTTINSAIATSTGTLTKDGNGTLILSGANTYTRATTINAGNLTISSGSAISDSGVVTLGNATGAILHVAASETIGTLSGGGSNGGDISIAASQALTVNQTATGTFAGIISGSGALTKNGSSTLTLTGGNSYDGITTINAGTLTISNNTALGSTVGGTTISTSASLNLQGNITVGAEALAFNGGTSGFLRNVSGNNTWNGDITVGTINSRIRSEADLLTIGGNITLNNNGVFEGASNTTVTGVISGGSGLTLGANMGPNAVVTFAGNNTYTGATTITAGTLQIGAGGTSGSLSASTSITNNANLVFNRSDSLTVSNAISGTGNMTQAGAGTLVLTGNNAYNGTTTINAGTLQIGAGDTSGNLSISSSITNNGTLAFNRSGTITQGTNFANSISGTGNLTQAGSGTLVLGGTNSYTGLTTISAGNLSISTVSAVAGTSGINLANATSLIYTGSAATLNRDISVTGTTGSTGTIRNESAGLLTLSGTLSKNGTTLALQGGSGGITVSGSIVGSNANSDLIIDGGSVTLAAANTYNGPTTIKNGATLNANITGALPIANGRSDVLIDPIGSAGSTLVLGASQSIASLSGAASSNVTLGSNNTLTIGTTSGNTTYAGRITGGNASALVKDGASTQVLTGNNTGFTGTTTINSGTLQAASVNALGSNNTVQVNGGTLLVSTDDAINGMTVTLNSTSTTVAALSFNSNYNGTIQKLTLSANSIIDLGPANSIALAFADLAMGLYNLSIYNWSGTTKWGTTYGTGTDTIFFGNQNTPDYNLSNVKFYSGAVGSDSFVGSGFEVMPQTTWEGGFTGHYILPVPEPETWATGILLLLGGAWWMIKRTRKAA